MVSSDREVVKGELLILVMTSKLLIRRPLDIAHYKDRPLPLGKANNWQMVT
jgi:hypothetical protein